MIINFILPFFPKKPGGGSKIIYEYANRLATLGHDVMVYHVNETPYMDYSKNKFIRLIGKLLLFPLAKPNWFKFVNNLKAKHISKVTNKNIRDADAIIGTWWAIAYEINKLDLGKGKKINLIQDYETWTGYEDLVNKSYELSNTNIVIADYLKSIVYKFSKKEPFVLYNAVDNNIFYKKNAIDKRNKFSIAMMYSEEPRKGSKYGLEAISILKQKYPNIIVNIFSVYPKPEFINLDFINYYQNPINLTDIYNDSAIFITSSITEGWGLPATEAMLCGCAVVGTDIEGHKGFLFNEYTGLGVSIKNVQEIVCAVERLILNDNLRLTLASNGNEYCKKFNWESNINQLISIIK